MGSWAKRLIDNWPLALALAAILALMPIMNWLGLALAIVVLLRHGSVVVSIGYFGVALLAYFTFAGHSFALVGEDISGLLVMFLPLWVMAIFLRQWRSLSVSLIMGTASMMMLVLIFNLIKGTQTLEDWLAYFNCRMDAVGVTHADVLAMTSGQSYEQAVQMVMLGWPFALMLMQLGVLMLSRWMQAKLYYPGGFARDFHGLRLPKWVALVMGGLLLGTSFATAEMVTLVHLGLLAMLLLSIVGLGFIHWYVAFKRYSPLWLVGVYGITLGTSMAVMPMFAVIALLDSGLNFRQRLSAAS